MSHFSCQVQIKNSNTVLRIQCSDVVLLALNNGVGITNLGHIRLRVVLEPGFFGCGSLIFKIFGSGSPSFDFCAEPLF